MKKLENSIPILPDKLLCHITPEEVRRYREWQEVLNLFKRHECNHHGDMIGNPVKMINHLLTHTIIEERKAKLWTDMALAHGLDMAIPMRIDVDHAAIYMTYPAIEEQEQGVDDIEV